MTDRERAERAAFDAYLREKIAKKEITPEDAEVEMDYFLNGFDSRENLCGL